MARRKEFEAKQGKKSMWPKRLAHGRRPLLTHLFAGGKNVYLGK